MKEAVYRTRRDRVDRLEQEIKPGIEEKTGRAWHSGVNKYLRFKAGHEAVCAFGIRTCNRRKDSFQRRPSPAPACPIAAKDLP